MSFSKTIPRSLLLLVSAAILTPSVLAFGDFPCSGSINGTRTCAEWSTSEDAEGIISADAICRPDPFNADVSYCGYASAPCKTGDDCDYGSCGDDGRCRGYLGDNCSPTEQCQAFFFCGVDGICGGTGAACNNGLPGYPIPNPERQCLSQSCDTTNKVCISPPAEGMAVGLPCSLDDNCETGACADSNICVAAAAAPSNGGQRKAKRYVLNGSGPNVNSCPAGLTACAVGASLSEGFECIDSKNNLEQCGGCVSNGEGEDCTSIHGVEAVECQEGRCIVLSCVPGLVVSADSSACSL